MVEIKNLKLAAQRVRKSIKNGQNIILCSDADLDGVSSLIILEEAINSLGGKVVLRYFPNREKEGYGLNQFALKKFKKYAPALLIISDSGIANWQEIIQAKKMAIETIVIDHHEVLKNELPKALFIVDPKQPGDQYPFKLLAACGLCFLFSKELLQEKMSKEISQSALELAAIGTIADMMPEEADNKKIIDQGLFSIKNSFRPALQIFSQVFDDLLLSQRSFAEKIISITQLTDFQENLTESYILFTLADNKQAEKMVKKLIEKNKKRRVLIKELTGDITKKHTLQGLKVIFEASELVPHLLTGNISSKISRIFKSPAFILAKKKGISRGSARSPKTINCLEGIKACSDCLETYGGHPQAAGFSIKNKNLKKFEKCLTNYFINLDN